MTQAELFSVFALNPREWVQMSIGQVRVAHVLWQRQEAFIAALEAKVGQSISGEEDADINTACWGPCYMIICGYALENLVKGLLICRQKATIKDHALPASFNHRLGNLLQEAGISISKDERRFLEIVERSVMWQGRYCVPMKASGAKSWLDYPKLVSAPRRFGEVFLKVVAGFPSDFWKGSEVNLDYIQKCLSWTQ